MDTTVSPDVTIYLHPLIEILPITAQVIDTDYVEIESRLLQPEIKLDSRGLYSLWVIVGDLLNGQHKIQFSYMCGDVDLEVSGEVSMNEYGVKWHKLTATDEDGKEYIVTFDAKEFNARWLN